MCLQNLKYIYIDDITGETDYLVCKSMDFTEQCNLCMCVQLILPTSLLGRCINEVRLKLTEY